MRGWWVQNMLGWWVQSMGEAGGCRAWVRLVGAEHVWLVGAEHG